MMTLPKVTGVIQCKNEWGLLALSIAHALIHHVDDVYVLNDSSSDETFHGLQRLEAIWPGRLHVIHQNNGIFQQEAQLNILVLMARASNPDWIYIFDADEFLITPPNRSLRDFLAKVPRDCASIRYGLKNFVCPRNFNEYSMSDYSRVEYEGVPDPNMSMRFSEQYEAIYKGKLNFFHIPFPSKVIFRNLDSMRIIAGSHDIVHYTEKPREAKSTDAFYAAHLSWLSMDRLERKAEQGKKHIDKGYPRRHGWQNQLIYQFASENRLAPLWEKHSIPEPDQAEALAPTNIRKNTGFREAIQPAVNALLQGGFDASDLSIVNAHRLKVEAAPPTTFQFPDLVDLAHHYHQILGKLPKATLGRRLSEEIRRMGPRFKRSVAKRWKRFMS